MYDEVKMHIQEMLDVGTISPGMYDEVKMHIQEMLDVGTI